MQLRADQLEAQLAKAAGALKPVYTLHGDEPLLAMEAADAVRAAARAAGYAERQVFTVSGAHFDWSSLLGAALEQSLFAQRKLIEIRIPSGKPGKEGSEALQAYAGRAAGQHEVLTLVTLPRLDLQQQKSAWFAALDAAGASVRIDGIERAALPAWLAQRLARHGLRVKDGEEGQRTLAFFADRVEGNLLAAHQEVNKLALLHPPGEIGFDAVEGAVLRLAHYDIAKLGAALWAGQVGRTLRMLDGLEAEGESAVFVHWSLAEDVRALARVRAGLDGGQPLPLALKGARVGGAKERWFERVAPQLTARRLAHLLDAGAVCDGITKGLDHPAWPSGAWPGLRHWVLMLLQAVAAGERGARVRLALTA